MNDDLRWCCSVYYSTAAINTYHITLDRGSIMSSRLTSRINPIIGLAHHPAGAVPRCQPDSADMASQQYSYSIEIDLKILMDSRTHSRKISFSIKICIFERPHGTWN